MKREQAELIARGVLATSVSITWDLDDVVEAILKAVTIEREECARMFDTEPHREMFWCDIAEAIRARSNEE